MRPKNPPLVLTEQRKWRTGAEPDEKAAREIQATYYGMNSKVDHLAGQVIDAMDRQNLWANTTVLLWFDYGDCAGQFCLPEKHDTHFHDCLLRTPLVLCDPTLEAGQRYDGLTAPMPILPPRWWNCLDAGRCPPAGKACADQRTGFIRHAAWVPCRWSYCILHHRADH